MADQDAQQSMHLTHRVMVGRASDLHHARQAYTSLQNHGIDASDLKIAGETAVEAQGSTMSKPRRAQIDRRMVEFLGIRVAGGAVAGALGVAGIAAAVGAILVATDTIAWPLFGAIVAAAFFFGGTFGAFVSMERSTGYTDTWELTFDDDEGAAWVAVRVRDDTAAQRVRHLLEHHGIEVSEDRLAEDDRLYVAHW